MTVLIVNLDLEILRMFNHLILSRHHSVFHQEASSSQFLPLRKINRLLVVLIGVIMSKISKMETVLSVLEEILPVVNRNHLAQFHQKNQPIPFLLKSRPNQLVQLPALPARCNPKAQSQKIFWSMEFRHQLKVELRVKPTFRKTTQKKVNNQLCKNQCLVLMENYQETNLASNNLHTKV